METEGPGCIGMKSSLVTIGTAVELPRDPPLCRGRQYRRRAKMQPRAAIAITVAVTTIGNGREVWNPGFSEK